MFSLQIVCFKTTLTTSGFKRIKEHDGRNVFENKEPEKSGTIEAKKLRLNKPTITLTLWKKYFFLGSIFNLFGYANKIGTHLKKNPCQFLSLPIKVVNFSPSTSACMYVCMCFPPAWIFAQKQQLISTRPPLAWKHLVLSGSNLGEGGKSTRIKIKNCFGIGNNLPT